MTEFYTAFEEAFAEGLTAGLYLRAPSLLFTIAAYVFTALGMFCIAKRRGIHHAWLSWIPIGNMWVLGALSDQYRYITRGETRNKRKALLILSIVSMILSSVLLIVCGILLVRVISMAMNETGFTDFTELGIQVLGLLLLLTPTGIVSIVIAVIRYIALFDVFASTDPRNRWLYLILCLLSSYALPLILFFNRDRDEGMPPRIPEPAYQPPCQPEPGSYVPYE